MTTDEVLRYHSIRYPLMQPNDAVKLLYQNEFGGGHLIEDSSRSLAWIKKEYSEIKHDKAQELIIPIGNGVVRYNLHALCNDIMPLTRLNEIFVESSRLVCGNVDSFREKLELLVKLTDKKLFSFSSDEIREYLFEYGKQGYPPVSHSLCFRSTYDPAYRVILERLI